PQPPAFSPDGRTVAVDERGTVSLWEVASGHSRGRLAGPRMTFALAFSPDGRFLAVGTDPNVPVAVTPPGRRLKGQVLPAVGADPEAPVTLWDLTAGEAVGRLEADCGRVNCLAFSPDGSRLAVGSF